MLLYHATFQAYLPSIMEKGLLPNQQKNLEDCEPGFVYLAKDMDAAISYCEVAEDTYESSVSESGICCFEISTENIDIKKLVKDPNILEDPDEDNGCYAYAGEIPSRHLRLCWQEE